METSKIIQALRCATTIHLDEFCCDECPYFNKTPLTQEQRAAGLPEDWGYFCDSDQIMLDAAKRLEELEGGKDNCGPGQWIDVENLLPEEEQRVIVCRRDGKVEQGTLRSANLRLWKVFGTNTKDVTYWMLMPDAPREE